MGKRYTQEEVIERFKMVHGNKYDYSKVEYTKMLEKVCITCEVHGEFWMRPNDHLFKHGCPSCGGEVANKKRIKQEKQTTLDNGKTAYDMRYEKIHQTRRTRDNYTSAARKRICTMRTAGTYNVWRQNWYDSMVGSGHFDNPAVLLEFKKYKRKVYRETKKTLAQWGYAIGYDSTTFACSGLVVDHMYSVKEGFANQVPVSVIAHVANLQLLSVRENATKGKTCALSMVELVERIQHFNQLNPRR